MKTPRYRLVIIGAGSAGLAAADFAARLGVRVALVERQRVGGDCTWTGCVPSKALLHAAAVAHTVRTAAAVGVGTAPPAVDFARVMASVQQAIDRVYAHETPAALARRGIHVLHGEARFLDPHTLDVNGRRIAGERFLIATGAQPVIPPVAGLAEAPYLTYETVFGLTALPRRLLVLGTGPVGVELAQAFQRLGATVTLVDRGTRVLRVADPEASALLQDVLAAEGVTLRLGTRVSRVVAEGAMVCLKFDGERLCGDALLVAVGRRPALTALALDRAGVAWSPHGVRVDGHLQTSQPHIYASGDAIGSFQFTHYAGWQGAIAARNALLPGQSRGQHATAPWTVFTDPAVAQVGWTEAQARDRNGPALRVTRWPIDRIDRAVTDGATRGLLKLVQRQDGRLVGATLVCPHAGELANELQVALHKKLSLAELASAIHIYPTYGFALQQAAAGVLVRDLTSGVQGVLLRVLARRWPWA